MSKMKKWKQDLKLDARSVINKRTYDTATATCVDAANNSTREAIEHAPTCFARQPGISFPSRGK